MESAGTRIKVLRYSAAAGKPRDRDIEQNQGKYRYKFNFYLFQKIIFTNTHNFFNLFKKNIRFLLFSLLMNFTDYLFLDITIPIKIFYVKFIFHENHIIRNKNFN